MNHRPFLVALLLVASAPAIADEPAAPAAPVEATRVPAAAPAERAVDDRLCLRETGTRIRARASRSAACPSHLVGRSYSRDDLDRTGHVDIAQALRMLDPSIY